MDQQEFESTMASSIPNDDASNANANLEQLLSAARKREEELLKGKKESEIDFGQKRAKFMELFRQKEEELNEAKGETIAAIKSKEEIESQLNTLKSEIEDLRTNAAISEGAKEDEIEVIKRKCQEEIASLQLIMKEAIAQTNQDTADKYEHELHTFSKANEKLEAELHDIKAKLKEESFLSSMAKSLQKKVANAQLLQSSEADNLEESYKKAQEDTEILKSVVMPLEEEIGALKQKIRDYDAKIQLYEGKGRPKSISDPTKPGIEHGANSIDGSEYANGAAALDEKVKELNHSLETEKSSRTDLEMYVAVLNTQKTVLQEDTDKLRLELQEVCQILEQEKREHEDLKRTWQMANDQFLESQRLLMMDMRRMESVLSSEQQRQIGELQKKDAEREAQEKKVKELEEKSKREKEEQEQRREEEKRKSLDKPTPIAGLSKTSIDSNEDDDLLGLGEDGMKRSHSSGAISTSSIGLLDSGVQELDGSVPRSSPVRNLPSLTEAQQKAITDPTPENEASQSLLAGARAKTDSPYALVAGKRLVSDKEWNMLHKEIKAARDKLGKPCDMCHNYESQLQAVQENDKKSQAQVRTLDRQLQSERQVLANQGKYVEEMEETLKSTAEMAEKEITTLVTKVTESEKYITGLRQQLNQNQNELQDLLKTLTEGREEIQRELTKLQDENESLVGKHSKNAQQMQEESINLPNNLEEMQLTLLKYREEIIQAKVAREHIEETLKSEIMFLKSQVSAEQQEKAVVEETLSQEVSQLQESLAIHQSVKTELERQTTLRQETDNKLKETEKTLASVQAKSKQLVNALQQQLEEQARVRAKLEQDVLQLRIKTQALQKDLDNSETVQKDFVKLSQSLQIQMEKIRSSGEEVRWQHEEDVDDCSNCKQQFTVTKRKHHCRHCGHVYCADCVSQTVNSGPHLRPSRVCDVCHTMLVPDAQPYYSTEPPSTPD